MIEKGSRPSDKILRWWRQEVPRSTLGKVPGTFKMWDQVPKIVGPSTKYWFDLIFIDWRPEKIQENKYLKVPFGTLQSL